MKTSLLLIISLVVILTMSSFIAKESPVSPSKPIASKQVSSFAFFRTHNKGKGVAVTWGMTTNQDIVDFTVQRTYEDPTDPYANWEDIAVIAVTSKRSFTYEDNDVFPGNIYYRIVALHTDASTATSELSGVRIRSRR